LEKDMAANILDWCKRERSSREEQLGLLTRGKFRTGEDVGHGWVDTTAQTIETARRSIAELDRTIAAYERARTG
jgi:hypothetical protein